MTISTGIANPISKLKLQYPTIDDGPITVGEIVKFYIVEIIDTIIIVAPYPIDNNNKLAIVLFHIVTLLSYTSFVFGSVFYNTFYVYAILYTDLYIKLKISFSCLLL